MILQKRSHCSRLKTTAGFLEAYSMTSYIERSDANSWIGSKDTESSHRYSIFLRHCLVGAFFALFNLSSSFSTGHFLFLLMILQNPNLSTTQIPTSQTQVPLWCMKFRVWPDPSFSLHASNTGCMKCLNASIIL